MRIPMLFAALALAACAHTDPTALSQKMPGLRVADAAMAGGAPQVALSVTQGVLAKEPRNTGALLRQGNALYELNRMLPAADSYRRVLAIAPRDTEAEIGLARIDLASDPAAAEALLRKVVAREPHNVTAQNDLGIACDLQGRHQQAQEAYRHALAVSPDLTAAQVNLGLSLALGGDAPGGVAILQPLAADPSASARVRQDLAAALVLGGDTDRAERILSPDLGQSDAAEAMMGYAALRP